MAAAAITLAATAARADPPRVALEHEGLAAATEARLRAELLGLGFEVVDARRGPGEGARDAARRTGAVAVVREVPSGMEIWVRSGLTILEPGRGADDATMALRTVEVVRASLLDVRPAPRRGRRRPPPAREAPLPRFSVEVSAAALASPGGLSVAPGVILGARWMPGRFVGLGATVAIPFLAARVSAAEGSAAVRPTLFGAGVRLATRLGDRWMPGAEVGVAAAWMSTVSQGAKGYVGRTEDHALALPYVRAGLAAQLTRGFALRADILAGFAAPRPTIVFAGRTTATWGQPLLAPSFGLEALWP